MNLSVKYFVIVAISLASVALDSRAEELSAFYSKVDSGQDFERFSRTGPYADVVVEVGSGKLVFARSTSYLPYWETKDGKWSVEEIVPRKGDGPQDRPDRVNTYSRVAIIKSTPTEVVVYWRYLPTFSGTNPHEGVDATKFVEECFAITDDGSVTRTIRQGTEKFDDWKDPLNRTTQSFTLTPSGIAHVETSLPKRSRADEITVGSPLVADIPGSPSAWWRFDEGKGDETAEHRSGSIAAIAGHKSLWKPGVSGSALQFDGYNTEVRISSDEAPQPTEQITVEGWIAIGAYPWSWAPIVQQMDDVPEELTSYEVDSDQLTGEAGGSENSKDDEVLNVSEEFVIDDQNDLEFEEDTSLRVAKKQDFDLTDQDYTIVARVITEEGGTIFSQAPKRGRYEADSKSFFISEGRLQFDLGFHGVVVSSQEIDDEAWHVVAMTYKHDTGDITLYIDGEEDGSGILKPDRAVENEQVLRIGFTTTDFPDEVKGFVGSISHLGFFQRVLSRDEIGECGEGNVETDQLVSFWNRFDHSEDLLVDATETGHDAELEEVFLDENEDENGDAEEDEDELEDENEEGFDEQYDREDLESGQDKDEFVFVLKPENDTGYFLGIDGHGHAGFKLRAGDTWQELVSDSVLSLGSWHHVAGVYDGQSGRMSLFVDGKLVGMKSTPGGPINLSEKDIVIGKGKPRRPCDPVRANTFLDSFSLDGVLDEVRIHEVALSEKQVSAVYAALKPDGDRDSSPLRSRKLPTGYLTTGFGARYEHLKFYDSWDNLWRFGEYPDVTVCFDNTPCQFVFWRGCGYIPMLVNDKGQWYSNEFNETWSTSGGQGCQEPMSDKESYTNHVRIIENTEARVVVHWRYPLIDVLHVSANYDEQTGWSDWADWYYYIYPDGVAAKTMHLWTHGERNHEYQESMAILGPHQHPEQVLETAPALVLANLAGHVTEYLWKDGPPKDLYLTDQKIHVVNYRSDFDPFTIGDFRGGDVYNGELTDYSVFPSWNHWPVAQMPSDGRYASYPDRTSHCSLSHVQLPIHKEDFGDRPYEQRVLLEGMTDASPEGLVSLARSWLLAPKMKQLTGAVGGEYQPGQKAYLLDASDEELSFVIEATEQRPIVNPCFVIKNWKADGANVTVKSPDPPAPEDIRVGRPRTVRTHDIVVWIEMQSDSDVKISISGK